MAQITLKDIAKALNLSPSTVSRAMRDHPAISKKTRKIVKDYAEAHKYKPNRLALQLRTNKNNTIGVIARVAKELGILTVGIVTIPFVFEGSRKIVQALKGVEEIAKNVDALLVINNERLRDIYSDLTVLNAFAKADDTLTTAAKSIAEIITVHGHVNLDFADVNTTLKDGGVAIMSSGKGTGSDRINEAIKDALHSPLLNNNDVFNSKKILINLCFGEENPLMMEEMNALHDFMSKFSNDIEVIWGAAVDESLDKEVKVTLLATGFSINNVPGIEEIKLEESKADELQRKIQEDEERKREIKDKELIEKYYGKAGLETLSANNYRQEPFILTLEELDDDKILEALEKNPVFKRDRTFNPRTYHIDKLNQSATLFD
jgi:cell division protein FtsZ